MTDSRTLDLYKSGHIIAALARTAMYAFGALFGLFMAMLAWLLVAAIIVGPALAYLMEMYCRAVWGR